MKSDRIYLNRYCQGLLSVEVTLSVGKRKFLFDTGAGITVVTPDLACQLGLVPYGRLTGHLQTGERVDMPRVDVAAIRVDDVTLYPTEIGVWDVNARLPAAWPEVSGVLALNAFDGRVLYLDLSRQLLLLNELHKLSTSTMAMTEVPLRIGRPAAGAGLDVFLGADTGRGLIWLELDSGNTGPTLVAPWAAELLGWKIESAGPTPAGTVKREIPEAELTLGGQRVIGPAIVKELVIDGNIGIPFLETHVVVLDLREARSWIATVEQGNSSD